METNKVKKYVGKVFLVLILGGPFVLFFLPATYFDHGQSLCISVLLFHVHCPGCGLTRGVMHLMHFDFAGAWEFNKLTFIVFPVMVLFWFHLLGKLINKRIFTFFDGLY